MLQDLEIHNCTYGCGEVFLNLHTTLGRENAQVQSRKYGKVLVINCANGENNFHSL